MGKEYSSINEIFCDVMYIYIYFSDRFFDSSLPSINPNQRQTGQNSKKHIREDAEVN